MRSTCMRSTWLAVAVAILLDSLGATSSRASLHSFTTTLQVDVASITQFSLTGSGYGSSIGGGWPRFLRACSS